MKMEEATLNHSCDVQRKDHGEEVLASPACIPCPTKASFLVCLDQVLLRVVIPLAIHRRDPTCSRPFILLVLRRRHDTANGMAGVKLPFPNSKQKKQTRPSKHLQRNLPTNLAPHSGDYFPQLPRGHGDKARASFFGGCRA